MELFKKLLRSGALYIVGGSFLSKLMAFLGSVVVVRLLSKGDYGILSSLESVYSYAYIIAGYGLNNALLRYAVLEEGQEGRKGILCHVLANGTAFNVALVLVSCFVSQVVPLDSDYGAARILFPVMIVALPLQYLFDSASFSLRALFANKQYALLSVLCVLVVWSFRAVFAKSLGLSGAAWSWPLAYGVLALGSLCLVFRKHFSGVKGKKPGKELTRAMRVYALQYMVTNGLWALFMQNDIFLIGAITGNPNDVALYKVAYTIPASLSVLTYAVGVFAAPYFVKHEEDKHWVWTRYKEIMGAICASVGALSIIIALFSSQLLVLLFGEVYRDATSVMQLLIISSFLNNALRSTTANLIAAMGRIKVNLVISALGMGMQIILDLMFIPVLGPLGCAYSSIIVYGTMAILVNIFFVREYRIV